MFFAPPIYRRDGDPVFNSSVLIDRHGKIAGVYDKLYPVMHEPNGKGGEFAGVKLAGVKGRSGSDAPVFQTDFGRVGMAICFDGQFPEVWQRLEDNGVQIVLFSSMYSAGHSLGAYATLHHYYVVSCCNWGECLAYDMTGDRLLAQRKGHVSRIVLDMDRRMVHLNDANNHVGKNNGRIAKLLAENPGVVVDTFMPAEDWEVLKAVRPGVDVPALMEKYGIRDLRTYSGPAPGGRPHPQRSLQMILTTAPLENSVRRSALPRREFLKSSALALAGAAAAPALPAIVPASVFGAAAPATGSRWDASARATRAPTC